MIDKEKKSMFFVLNAFVFFNFFLSSLISLKSLLLFYISIGSLLIYLIYFIKEFMKPGLLNYIPDNLKFLLT